MKKIFLLFLIISSLQGISQKKVSFTVLAGGNFTSSKRVESSFNTIEHNQISWVADTLTLGKNYYNYSLQSTYSGKYGFSVGVKAAYNVSDHFSLSAGFGISKSEIKRNNQLAYRRTKYEQVTVIYPQPPPGTFYLFIPGLETTGYEKTGNYYYHVYEENISMTSLQIPIEMVFKLNKNSKFDLKLGVTPTILLNYKLTPNKVSDTEITGGADRPPNLTSTERKFNLTACAGIGFPIYKSLSGNINYTRYFNTITEGSVIPAITPDVYGASLVYQLPNFKIK
jgi:hypothetical protein